MLNSTQKIESIKRGEWKREVFSESKYHLWYAKQYRWGVGVESLCGISAIDAGTGLTILGSFALMKRCKKCQKIARDFPCKESVQIL